MYLRVDVGIIMCVVVWWGGKVIFGLFMWEVSISLSCLFFGEGEGSWVFYLFVYIVGALWVCRLCVFLYM